MTGKRPRILSIDDEPGFTEMIQQYFEPRGYRIDVATEGRKGLDLFRNNIYDIVLLDLKMVGLNGDEIMREIKRRGDDIKVVFITAYCDSGRTKDRLMKEGAYAFVEKPITSLKLLENLVNEAFLNDRTGG